MRWMWPRRQSASEKILEGASLRDPWLDFVRVNKEEPPRGLLVLDLDLEHLDSFDFRLWM